MAGREWGHTKPGVMIGYRTLASDAHVQLVKVEHSGGRSQLTTGDDNPKCMYVYILVIFDLLVIFVPTAPVGVASPVSYRKQSVTARAICESSERRTFRFGKIEQNTFKT